MIFQAYHRTSSQYLRIQQTYDILSLAQNMLAITEDTTDLQYLKLITEYARNILDTSDLRYLKLITEQAHNILDTTNLRYLKPFSEYARNILRSVVDTATVLINL